MKQLGTRDFSAARRNLLTFASVAMVLTSPRLGAVELPLPLALGALGMFAVLRAAGSPQVFQTGSIVGELRKELGDRVVRVRGLGPTRFVAVGRRHGVKLLDIAAFVKTLDSAPPSNFAREIQLAKTLSTANQLFG